LIARLRGNSELKLERAWLVMRENLRQNRRFNFGGSGCKVAVIKVAIIPRATCLVRFFPDRAHCNP
jgi:hypothetical protein